MVDVNKAKAAVKAAQDIIAALITSTAVAASKNPGDVKGIGALVKAGESLTKAEERLDEAVERTTPKVKEEKDAKVAGKK